MNSVVVAVEQNNMISSAESVTTPGAPIELMRDSVLLGKSLALMQAHEPDLGVPHAGLTSRDILLDMQHIFLTSGMHEIVMPSPVTGRALVYEMLNALGCYETPYALSSPEVDKPGIVSLRRELARFAGSAPLSPDVIERYVLEQFYADFCWIEENAVLRAEVWYQSLLQSLYDSASVLRIPIIIVRVTGE